MKATATLKGSRDRMPSHDPREESKQAIKGLDNLVQKIAPWLFDVGSWIFGGLIAFNLFLTAALITVGPVDVATLISIIAFSSALPLNVTGIFLLRLVKDVQDIGIEELTLQSFKDAGFSDIETYFPPTQEREFQRNRRSNLTLAYASAIAALSVGLTLTGFVAALWHLAWWVALIFLVVVALSVALAAAIVAHTLPAESNHKRN
jgi:hypothetical protein